MNELVAFLFVCILLASIADVLLTTFTVIKIRKIRPDLDWKKIELNPSMRFFWKKFGLWGGSTAQFFLCLILITIVFLVFMDNSAYLTAMFAFYFGMQVTAIRIHLFNLKDMNKMKLKKRRKK